MVERVAREIFFSPASPFACPPDKRGPREEAAFQNHKPESIAHAQCAIRALRTPTPEMIQTYKTAAKGATGRWCLRAYEAMIDEALNNAPRP
jgi:hypothetical protein